MKSLYTKKENVIRYEDVLVLLFNKILIEDEITQKESKRYEKLCEWYSVEDKLETGALNDEY